MNAKIRLLTYLTDCTVCEGSHVDGFFNVHMNVTVFEEYDGRLPPPPLAPLSPLES